MSDLVINIRFGHRHLQVSKSGRVSFKKNDYWKYHPMPKWFEVYEFFS